MNNNAMNARELITQARQRAEKYSGTRVLLDNFKHERELADALEQALADAESETKWAAEYHANWQAALEWERVYREALEGIVEFLANPENIVEKAVIDGGGEMNEAMKDRFWLNLARHLPRKLIMWCAVVVFAHATSGENSNVECGSLTCVDALKAWDKREATK
ncbi:MAG: hypothetical protein WC710_14200 [Gallionella sp.]